jgi:hypothetical protein
MQDQVVDFWENRSLVKGGAGFFGLKGDSARLLTVQVSHQADAVGKVAAFLSSGASTQNEASTNASLESQADKR